jgi:hypothetical protein
MAMLDRMSADEAKQMAGKRAMEGIQIGCL